MSLLKCDKVTDTVPLESTLPRPHYVDTKIGAGALRHSPLGALARAFSFDVRALALRGLDGLEEGRILRICPVRVMSTFRLVTYAKALIKRM